MKHEEVSHKGRVLRVTPQFTTVSIEQQGACSACHAAGLCGMAEVTEKAVEVMAGRLLGADAPLPDYSLSPILRFFNREVKPYDA